MKEIIRFIFRGVGLTTMGCFGFMLIYSGVYAFKDIANVAGFTVLWKLFLSVLSFVIGIVFLCIVGSDE